ncbi:hypothetical protein EI74_0286 [Mycoplasma testudineum]|uniref:Uncharacterized protein n=1 Tax=Mycoplasma testudineum TaxID=244584 RepID=A0A4R6IFI8_9MOLU|nr:hypothetical protein [Mycoplasma testudineum]OYD26910.1 hypothetical protein CG473_01040 [Mycoplasma testudineum]TDO20458.1 hypothetical protein EI74_0286 [Mycoplasma testudineum]
MKKKTKWWIIGGVLGSISIIGPVLGVGISYALYIQDFNKIVDVENFEFLDSQENISIDESKELNLLSEINKIYGPNFETPDSSVFVNEFIVSNLNEKFWYEQLLNLSSNLEKNENLIIDLKKILNSDSFHLSKKIFNVHSFYFLINLYLIYSLDIKKNRNLTDELVVENLVPLVDEFFNNFKKLNLFNIHILKQYLLMFQIVEMSGLKNELISEIKIKIKNSISSYLNYSELVENQLEHWKLTDLYPFIFKNEDINLNEKFVEEFDNYIMETNPLKIYLHNEESWKIIERLKTYSIIPNDYIKRKSINFLKQLDKKQYNHDWSYIDLMNAKRLGIELKISENNNAIVPDININNFKFGKYVFLNEYLKLLEWNFRTGVIDAVNVSEWKLKTEILLSEFTKSIEFTNLSKKYYQSQQKELLIDKSSVNFWQLLGFDLKTVLFFFRKFKTALNIFYEPENKENLNNMIAFSFWSWHSSELNYIKNGKKSFRIKNGFLKEWKTEDDIKSNDLLVTNEYKHYLPEYVWNLKQLIGKISLDANVQLQTFKSYVNELIEIKKLITLQELYLWIKALNISAINWNNENEYLKNNVFGKVVKPISDGNIIIDENVINLNDTYYLRLIQKYLS